MNYVSSFYPQEHRTPPLPLVALLGVPELHREISDYFIQQHRPPLVFHGSSEPLEQFVARAFGPKKRSQLLSGQPQGILKSDWFAKHRGKKPAMAVALVERSDLEGDPTTYNRMLYGLKLIADSAGQRGAGVLVAVVQPQGSGELPPDRVQAVAHNLTLDRRLILPLPIMPPPGTLPDDPAVRHVRDAALGRLGKLVLELCTAYYSRLSKHVADKAVARRQALGGPLPYELAARTAFKLAVYAEFRQDWSTAVAHYREAYAAILNVQVGEPVRPQRWSEVCAVAELVHLKLLMLGVHQGRLEDAVAQVREHLAHFGRPAASLPPSAHSSHLGYLVRQYQVAAQEVGSHVDTMPAYSLGPSTASAAASAPGATSPGMPVVMAGPTGGSSIAAGPTGALLQQQMTGSGAPTAGSTGAGGWTGNVAVAPSTSLKDCSRSYLLMAAARLAVARRLAATSLRAARGGGGALAVDTAHVRRGPYVGQLVLRNESVQGYGYSPLTDNDYLLFLEAEECRLVTPAWVIDVMNSALLLLKDCSGAERLRSQLGGLMASEHMLANNLSAARKLLLQVCHQYRREGWLLPLLQSLVALREVAQRLRLPAEYLCYSLEIAALATQLQVQQPAANAHPASSSSSSAAAAGNVSGGLGVLAAFEGISNALLLQAQCASRVVDPAAALAACRSAVQTLITGISEIKQGIMKTQAQGTGGGGAAGPQGEAGGGQGDGAAAGSALPSGGSTSSNGSAGGTSGGLPRHFHYTVEHLNLHEAQRRAREAGDPRPVADIMHRHTQQDYGWCRCIALAAGFAYSRPDPSAADFYLALHNQLPLPLPLKGVVLHFVDDQGDVWVQALPGPIPADEPPATPLPHAVGSALDSATHSFHHLHLNTHLKQHSVRKHPAGAPAAAAGASQDPRQGHSGGGPERLPGHTHASPGPPSTSGPTPTPLHPSPSQSQGPGTSLPPHEWSHFSVRLEPRCLGRLRAERAILLLSDHATVVFKLASFPPASAASPQPGVLTGPLLVPPQAHPYSSWAAGRHRGGGVSAQDHAAAPFRSIRVNSFSLPPAPGAPPPTSKPKGSEGTSTFSSPAVNPGQLSLMVQHLGPLPTLSYGLPSGLALLGEHAPLLAALAVPSNGRPLAGASLEFVIGRTTGALQPSDIVLVVDDTEGTRGLMALNNERYRVPLPTVAPGCRHTVRLWARSAAAGSAVVAAVLLCPAQVTATAVLSFEEPFEFKCRMASELGVHTLTLPRLSARDLGATALTIGQPVMVTAMVRALQPAMLELAGAQVMLEPGAALKLVADPNQQLTAHSSGLMGPSPASSSADPSAPTCLSRGDVFTLLLPICPTELMDTARSMGRVNLRWRRPAGHVLLPQLPAHTPPAANPLAPVPPAPAAGAAGSGAGAARGGTGYGGVVSEQQAQQQHVAACGLVDPLAAPCPDPWVTTVLELPRVTVGESLLTARTLGPSQVTAGMPFTYSLQVQNLGSAPLELMVSLMDSPGFACAPASERSPSLAVPPRERANVSWSLTATAPGHQLLPGVRLLAPKNNCALTSQSQHVFVQPF